jgi:hypothetical protein
VDHMRNGDTLTRMAAGFEIDVMTAWRYVSEAIDLLVATADELDTAVKQEPAALLRNPRRHPDLDRPGRRP